MPQRLNFVGQMRSLLNDLNLATYTRHSLRIFMLVRVIVYRLWHQLRWSVNKPRQNIHKTFLRHDFLTNSEKKKKNTFLYSQIIESSSATICGFLKKRRLTKAENKSYRDSDKCLLLQKQKVEAYERGVWRYRCKMRNGIWIETIHIRNLTVKLKYILRHCLSMLLFR